MEFIIHILKFDYSLAHSGNAKGQKVVEALLYIFLTKVSFISFALFAILIKFIPYKFNLNVLVLMIMAVAAFAYCGFKSTTREMVLKFEIEKEYRTIGVKERRIRTTIGIIILTLVYFLSVFVVIKAIGGYSVK